jgi:hypothetical protein
MASPPHEILIELFRREPLLVPHLLRTAAGVEVPPFTKMEPVDTALRDLLPTELRADLLLLFSDGAPVFAVILEVQLRVAAEKARRWPTYVAAAHDRYGCPTALVVVTNDDAVAAWARGPFSMGPGSMVAPVVLDGSKVPRLSELPEAERTAAMALLSVGVHVRSVADLPLVRMAMDADMPGVDAFGGLREYLKLVVAVLHKSLRPALEEQMGIDVSDIVPWTDKYEARGEARGRVEAMRAVFRRMAAERGFALSAAHEARLMTCGDPERLSGWTVRLLKAASVDEAID